MSQWETLRLDQLCSMRTEQASADDLESEYYVAMEHVDTGRLSLSRWGSVDGVRSSKSRFRRSDILYGKLRPYLDKAVIAPFDGVCSTELLPLEPNRSKINPEFLALLLHTSDFISYAEATTVGVNHPRTSWASISRFVAQIPSLTEQSRITAVLKSFEESLRIEERLVEALASLKSATMAKLFQEGFRDEPLKQLETGLVPESWKTVRLGDIAKIGNGSTPKRTNADYWDGGDIPWITSTKIHEVIINRAEEFVTQAAFRECHLPLVPRKSLVVAITGQGKTLGNVALLETDTCINQHLAYVQFRDPSVLPEFYLFYLQSLYPYFRQVSSSGGSTKGALTCAFIANIEVPLPPKQEQQDIAHALMQLTRRHMIAAKRSEALSRLFAATLPQLMNGAICVKDFNLAEVNHA
ncbi:MAG: restriction endonuclease subunit S [Bryobacteraceae bacterium]|nr:restriction endonuclease subunit S [Bryobacteraceae bacterium]